jgi:hypothetical protein
MSSTVQTGIDVRSFQEKIPDKALDDSRRRIAATHWPTKGLVPNNGRSPTLRRAASEQRTRLAARRPPTTHSKLYYQA